MNLNPDLFFLAGVFLIVLVLGIMLMAFNILVEVGTVVCILCIPGFIALEVFAQKHI